MTKTIDRSDLSPLCCILWDGYRFRIQETREDRYFLICCDDSETHRELERAEVVPLLDANEIVVEPYHFNLNGTVAPAESAKSMLAGCTPEQQLHALTGEQWMLALDADYKAGAVKLHTTSLNTWRKAKKEDIRRALWLPPVTKDGAPKKLRKGQPTGLPDIEPPSASDLKRLYQKFRQPGFDVTDFVQRYDRCTEGGKRIDPEIELLVENTLLELSGTPTRMTRAGLRRHLKAVINQGELDPNNYVEAPADKTIRRILGNLEDGKMIGARFGFRKMEQARGTYSEGPRYTAVGEMVYMDSYKVDLVVLLKRCGIWQTITRAMRRTLVARRRVWVCVALDAATRVILGIGFGFAESSALALRVLRMAVSDKTAYAVVSGCQAKPPRAIGLAGLRTDSGIAFRSLTFRVAALSLTANTQIGAVGVSRHRGAIERLFRTINMSFLPYFHGRTFSNVVERGEYDAMGEASLFLEDFGNAFFRWGNDVYHLSKHRGLNEQPPINCFNETIAATSFPPVKTDDQLRVIFGRDITATLTSAGLRYMNIQYRSNWLAQLFKSKGPVEMRMKVDASNLGRISVLHNDVWQTVPGPIELQGIPLSFWLAKTEALARKHGEQAKVNFETVAKALLDFAKLSERSRCEAELEDRSYTSEALNNANRAMKIHVVYRPSTSGHVGTHLVTQGAFGGGFKTGANVPKGSSKGAAISGEDDGVAPPIELFGLDAEVIDQRSGHAPTLDDELSEDNEDFASEELLPGDSTPPAVESPPSSAPAKRRNKINKSF